MLTLDAITEPQKRERPTGIRRGTHKHAIKLSKPTKKQVDRLHKAGLLSDAMRDELYRTRKHWGTP